MTWSAYLFAAVLALSGCIPLLMASLWVRSGRRVVRRDRTAPLLILMVLTGLLLVALVRHLVDPPDLTTPIVLVVVANGVGGYRLFRRAQATQEGLDNDVYPAGSSR